MILKNKRVAMDKDPWDKEYIEHKDGLDRQMVSAVTEIGTAIKKAQVLIRDGVNKNRTGSAALSAYMRPLVEEYQKMKTEYIRLAKLFYLEEID